MHSSFITAAVLLSSALATPHNKHIDSHRLRHGKKYHQAFGNTTVPVETGTGLLGPTGASPSAGVYISYAQVNTDKGSATLASTTVPDVPHSSVEAIQTVDTNNANADNCAAAVTITVPASTTETVTISASASNMAPTTLSISSADTIRSSSSIAAVVASASSASIEPSSLSAIPTSTAPTATPPSPAPSQASSESTTLAEASVVSSAIGSSASASSALAPPAPTSSAPAVNPPAPQALPFKTKRGVIASGNSQNELTAAIGTGKISWLGNWYSAPPPTIPSNIQFVPQNYNPDSDADGTFTKNAQAQIDSKGAKYFLSYGEPAAAKLSVEEIVQLFKKSMQPFADIEISVSSPTTLQNDNDFEWLEQFLQACEGCGIGFLAIHYMNTYNDGVAMELKNTLNRAHDLANKYKIPGGVWLDNFEVVGSVEQQKGFLAEVVPWLDAQDWVKAYAYVPDEVGKAGSGPNFIDESGALNELGRFYAGL
ncbi:MAG: hypothetical protein LQ343_005887 [Gyalolechia ehrenbergii]|nr:MAG: hypothetical protein LQ343_005887 [Gyalolechia ehrenbergii]